MQLKSVWYSDINGIRVRKNNQLQSFVYGNILSRSEQTKSLGPTSIIKKLQIIKLTNALVTLPPTINVAYLFASQV